MFNSVKDVFVCAGYIALCVVISLLPSLFFNYGLYGKLIAFVIGFIGGFLLTYYKKFGSLK